MKEDDYLEGTGVDGSVILKLNINSYIGWEGAPWIELAEDRQKWRAVLNAVMNIRVPYNEGKLLNLMRDQ